MLENFRFSQPFLIPRLYLWATKLWSVSLKMPDIVGCHSVAQCYSGTTPLRMAITIEDETSSSFKETDYGLVAQKYNF